MRQGEQRFQRVCWQWEASISSQLQGKARSAHLVSECLKVLAGQQRALARFDVRNVFEQLLLSGVGSGRQHLKQRICGQETQRGDAKIAAHHEETKQLRTGTAMRQDASQRQRLAHLTSAEEWLQKF